MTIDTGWGKILKTECPKAFTACLPEKCDTMFVDGQIFLMKSQHIHTWKQFIAYQFTDRIAYISNKGGGGGVGFDNYTHVPMAKQVTQLKRNNKTKMFAFGEADDIPVTCRRTVSLQCATKFSSKKLSRC